VLSSSIAKISPVSLPILLRKLSSFYNMNLVFMWLQGLGVG
jgi:hypothetical protein